MGLSAIAFDRKTEKRDSSTHFSSVEWMSSKGAGFCGGYSIVGRSGCSDCFESNSVKMAETAGPEIGSGDEIFAEFVVGWADCSADSVAGGCDSKDSEEEGRAAAGNTEATKAGEEESGV
jgi:hypothetical protein